MKRVAILGASGYTGCEVRRLVTRHPALRLESAQSARAGHQPAPPAEAHEPEVAPLDLARLRGLDGVFLCTPHGVAAELAREALDAGCAVVDLSADFRLRDPEVYARTYGAPHREPALLAQAVYGLTEHRREQVRGARLVANPGCYPTSILLPLLPLLRHELLDPSAPVIADAKSGVSGAGATPTERNVFGAVHENFSAYGVGTHRHGPEIAQEAGTDRIVFVPHLLPVFRGILTTLYLRPSAGVARAEITACLEETYAHEPFVRVYRSGLPQLNAVQRSNHCDVGTAQAGDHVVVVSALDNLVKGAAGQAVQNMNVMLGLEETGGLL